jgi:hypothetical protein
VTRSEAQGNRSIGGLEDAISFLRQDFLRQCPDRRLVLDEQDSLRISRAFLASGRSLLGRRPYTGLSPQCCLGEIGVEGLEPRGSQELPRQNRSALGRPLNFVQLERALRILPC